MSVTGTTRRASPVRVNGTDIYHEVRGSGPAILFISGMTGDAGHYAEVAELLASEFTVVTYDRRGNSRSPRPPGWAATSIDEQADDAAGLLDALALAPAAVWGSSGGAIILLNLLRRRPDVIRRAFVHEPPTTSVLSYGNELVAGLRAMLEEAFTAGGPTAAMERFLRVAAGDRAFDGLDRDLRARMLGNADVGLRIEFDAFIGFDPTTIRRPEGIPVVTAAGIENRDPEAFNHFMWDTTEWLAKRWGTEVVTTPGAHVPYFTHPKEFAEQLRALLR
jgi:pimeloyl-ACP methyl ester carboxylesterase